MGTKNNPGKFDCYTNAEPDEPMFILLGRDPTASLVVMLWHGLKTKMKSRGTSQTSEEKLNEANECARAMKTWAKEHGKDPEEAFAALEELLREKARGNPT